MSEDLLRYVAIYSTIYYTRVIKETKEGIRQKLTLYYILWDINWNKYTLFDLTYVIESKLLDAYGIDYLVQYLIKTVKYVVWSYTYTTRPKGSMGKLYQLTREVSPS